MKYHFVWTPKYRGKVLADTKVKQEVKRIIEQIVKWKHWELLELNIQDDHIHMVLILLPKDSPSYAMQIIKGKSSAWLKKKIKHKSKASKRHSLQNGDALFLQLALMDQSSEYIRRQD